MLLHCNGLSLALHVKTSWLTCAPQQTNFVIASRWLFQILSFKLRIEGSLQVSVVKKKSDALHSSICSASSFQDQHRAPSQLVRPSPASTDKILEIPRNRVCKLRWIEMERVRGHKPMKKAVAREVLSLIYFACRRSWVMASSTNTRLGDCDSDAAIRNRRPPAGHLV